MSTDLIAIQDLDGLLTHMQQATLWVEWQVRCAVGPDWLGGERTLQFYLDQRPLTDSPLHRALQRALIEVVHIPAHRSRTVITGEAEVRSELGRLLVDWEWSEAAPYEYPRGSGSGTATLVEIPTLRSELSTGCSDAEPDPASTNHAEGEAARFSLVMTNPSSLTAQLTQNGMAYDIQLAGEFWTANDYLAHWGMTSYDLLDDYRTKFLILEARPTRSPKPIRAFRVSRIADRFHFHDVLIQAPSEVGDYKGESFIEWLNRPKTPTLVTERQVRCDRIPEFIVDRADFERWQVQYLDASAHDVHRRFY
ncbi:MAG: hypothetical protein AAFU71_19210 [Cyanobacteria bacterium J06632_22]